jgi:hypothetical protein
MDHLLFNDAASTACSYLASGELQDIWEDAALPCVKVALLIVASSMRARGQHVGYEDSWKERTSFNPFSSIAEIERQRFFFSKSYELFIYEDVHYINN